MKKTVLLVMLFFASFVINVTANNNQSDSIVQKFVAEFDSLDQQYAGIPLNDTQTTNAIFQQQTNMRKGENFDYVLFWVTIITSVATIIMLLIAIQQLRKQRSDSKSNSESTKTLLENLSILIQNHDKNATKAREDRSKVLEELTKGVCEINTQIFNNVLTDIAVKKQDIGSCCDDLCTLFRRTPNILKEDFPNQDAKVAVHIDRIEKSTATLGEMFKCYGSYNDDCDKTFSELMSIVERLKKEVGIATTKQQRETFINEIIASKNKLMKAVDLAIMDMKTKIEKYDA